MPKRLQTWDLPAAAGPSSTDDWRLRYLDKRRDFFTYLRFADCVFCCFHSRSSWYERTQRWALAVWKDPRGEMPDAYLERRLDFVRWRALKRFRNPETEIYDDLTTSVNRITSEGHLYWRRLTDN